MDLGIDDVAALLNVPESTVTDWVVAGEIPSYQINGENRFNRNEVENWVINRRVEDEDQQDESSNSQGGITQFSLYRAIHRGDVLQTAPGTTKEEIISWTMKRITERLDLDSDVLTELLLDRERLMPTALNNGIAVPHTRDFLLNAHFDIVTVVFPEQPIEYGALDGKPVHSLFFLFACEDKRHLNLLAKLAHFASRNDSLALLQSKPDKKTLLNHVKDWEGNLSQR